jgi:multicomponent Na+:H+ antiporter subunit D
MLEGVPPGLILILGALLAPLFRGRLKQAYLLLLPALSFLHVVGLPGGHVLDLVFMGYELQPVRVDKLSLVFGYAFHIAAFLGVVYSLHVKDNVQQVMSLVYAGAGIAALFAGDLVTLFVYWELTAVSSVFLIWASRSKRSFRVGMRYLIIQVGSGVILLSGVILHFRDTGSLLFGHLGLVSAGTALILLAFGIKAAFPLLHNWLQDAYPEATPTGTVFLSVFTTKLAIYTLARGYAGTESLIWIGAIMTLFPIFFAVIENDLRRVLAYSLNNQLGFMIVGIGIGTELALNGAAAHAFAHIIYKSLLFMSMGAVLHRTGTIKASELGGLYKSMPLTAAFCMVGSLSIAGFPLFSGFVTKSMILTAGGEGHMLLLSIVLLVASAGVVDHSGIKIPFFAFFAHDSGRRVKEAPTNMLAAMAGAAAICIGVGLYPKPLYALLPYPVEYVPYTTTHVVTTAQLLLFAALGFVVLMRVGFYPPEVRSVNLDSDWIYRKALPALVGSCWRAGSRVRTSIIEAAQSVLDRLLSRVRELHGPAGLLARTWSTSAMVLWSAILLVLYLVLYLI